MEARMTVGRFGKNLTVSAIGALLLIGAAPARALAQGDHSHGIAAQPQEQTAQQKARTGALIKAVQEATERFQQPGAAEAEGCARQFGGVSGGDSGAGGLPCGNGAVVGDGGTAHPRPEIVLYEPLPNGKLRLTGADYL